MTSDRDYGAPLFFGWRGSLHVAFTENYEHFGIYRLTLVTYSQIDATS